MIPNPVSFPSLAAWAARVVQIINPIIVDLQNSYTRQNSTHRAPSYTVATLPSASVAGKQIFVSDETGGAVMAFSDGTNWRRVTDRAVVS